MLIVALVLAVIGLAALVTAVVTSNEVIAWVCIGASVLGVLLLIIDAVRERNRRDAGQPAERDEAETDDPEPDGEGAAFDADYPEDAPAEADAEPPPDPGIDDTTEFARLPESAEDADGGTVNPAGDPVADEVTGEDREPR